MLKRLPFKKKYLFAGATVFMLLVSYRFAFKNTIDAWLTNTQLKKQLSQNTDIGFQPGYLERKGNNIDKILERYKADTTTFRNKVITTSSLLAEKVNVKLIDVPIQDINYISDHFIIQRLNFEGDFFALTSLVRQLELSDGIGVLRSMSWRTVDVRLNSQERRKLVLELFLQISK